VSQVSHQEGTPRVQKSREVCPKAPLGKDQRPLPQENMQKCGWWWMVTVKWQMVSGLEVSEGRRERERERERKA
jgi:hypothetical protein